MAFTAKDGSKHTNKDSQKRADAKFGAKSAPAAVREPDEREGGPGDNPEEEGMEMEHPSGAEVAAQHGPAMIVDIQHDHMGGHHEVNSMHADGHQHSSVHPDAHSAHKHAMELAGVGEGGEEDREPEREHEEEPY